MQFCAACHFMQFDLHPHQQFILFYFSLQAIVLSKNNVYHAAFSATTKIARELGQAVYQVQQFVYLPQYNMRVMYDRRSR